MIRYKRPLAVAAVATLAAGLSVAVAGPALAATSLTEAQFVKEFNTLAHKYEIGVSGKPILMVQGNTETYLDPSGDREVTTVAADGTKTVVLCHAPNPKGFMSCYINNDGAWTPATLLDKTAKGWLSHMGMMVAEVRGEQTALADRAVEEQGSVQISRSKKPRVTRLTVTGTFPGLPASSESIAATFGPRSFSLIQRANDGAATSLASVTVVPKRTLSFPLDGAVLDHGWG